MPFARLTSLWRNLRHGDRVEHDLDEIGLDQDLAATGIVAVEWAERMSRRIPGAVPVTIKDLGDDRREIHID